MDDGPDPSATPLRCPLCVRRLPPPPPSGRTGDTMAALAGHFAGDCSAIPFLPAWA